MKPDAVIGSSLRPVASLFGNDIDSVPLAPSPKIDRNGIWHLQRRAVRNLNIIVYAVKVIGLTDLAGRVRYAAKLRTMVGADRVKRVVLGPVPQSHAARGGRTNIALSCGTCADDRLELAL